MVNSRIEGAVIVVELSASMRPPDGVQTGWEDIQRNERALATEQESKVTALRAMAEKEELLHWREMERDDALGKMRESHEHVVALQSDLQRRDAKLASIEAKMKSDQQLHRALLVRSRQQTKKAEIKLAEYVNEHTVSHRANADELLKLQRNLELLALVALAVG